MGPRCRKADFLDGRTLDRLIGTTREIQGVNYTITDLISERHQPWFNERWAVLEATLPDSHDPVIFKTRFQCNPSFANPYTRDRAVDWGMDSFKHECLALRECQDSGSTPKLLAQEKLTQERNDIYPGGYLTVIVMSKVPGERIIEFLRDLTEDEKETIRADLIGILEYLRLRNWNFAEQQPDQIFYDRATKRTAPVGLSRSGRNSASPSTESPLTAESIDVTAFCLEFLSALRTPEGTSEGQAELPIR
ncbi:hypothetical protein BJY00DRAFT_315716 [Aspergillus carlsbadensis]|nr:hypothetical protein BJY00DRAFT_315716 [Aspergillus carlsbadensis]